MAVDTTVPREFEPDVSSNQSNREEEGLQRRTSGTRLFQLDALRGLAAVIVVVYHMRYAFYTDPVRWYLLPLFSGQSAVVLFFVLSGYVLSLPYWEGRTLRYIPYLVRRFCRIYIPFLGAFAFSVFGAWYFKGRTPPLSMWFQLTWHAPLDLHLVLSQLLIWPTPEINTAFWSLRYEIQMSALMPVLCALLRRNALVATAATALVGYGRVSLMDRYDWHFLVSSFRVAVLFMIGATVARYRMEIRRFFKSAGGWGWLILLASLFLYYLFSARLDVRLPQRAIWVGIRKRSELIAAVGAAGIIASALNIGALTHLLEHRLPEYLGRISFSLYIVHGTILFAMLDIFYQRIPTVVLLPFIFGTCFAAAHAYCSLVETPSILWGKRLSARVDAALKG